MVRRHPQGWKRLFEELVRAIAELEAEAVIKQAKQKFGTFVFSLTAIHLLPKSWSTMRPASQRQRASAVAKWVN